MYMYGVSCSLPGLLCKTLQLIGRGLLDTLCLWFILDGNMGEGKEECECEIYICNVCIYTILTWKKFKNDGNQNFGADFCIVFSFDFEPVLAFLRRYLTFCVVFWMPTFSQV